MYSRDDPRVSNCRGTRHHAPIDRPTGATPCVPPKHIIVATIQPSWSPRWRNIPVHGATTVTMTPRSRGWPTGNNPRLRRRRDSAAETLDLCLLIQKITRFPHTSPVTPTRRLIDSSPIRQHMLPLDFPMIRDLPLFDGIRLTPRELLPGKLFVSIKIVEELSRSSKVV